MKTPARAPRAAKTARTAGTNRKHGRKGDALRVSLALVFILFASIASRDHETPEKVLEAREVAVSSHEERTVQPRFALPAIVKRLTGINGSI